MSETASALMRVSSHVDSDGTDSCGWSFCWDWIPSSRLLRVEPPGEDRLQNHDQTVRVTLAPDGGLRPRIGGARVRAVDERTHEGFAPVDRHEPSRRRVRPDPQRPFRAATIATVARRGTGGKKIGGRRARATGWI